MNFVHFPIYSVSLLFPPFNQLPFPHSFSYFSHLWINSNSPIHFPTFQWGPPFPHSFSYFFYLSKSSHSRIHFPTFQSSSIPPFIFLLLLPFNELPFRIHFLTFPIFQWAPLPPFIFLLFISFNELPFPYSFSWFFYLLLSSHSPIHFSTFPTVPFNKLPSPIHFPTFPTFQWASSIPPFIFLLFLPFN